MLVALSVTVCYEVSMHSYNIPDAVESRHHTDEELYEKNLDGGLVLCKM